MNLGEPEKHVVKHVDWIPGKNGGRLRNGGTNKGGTGRPKNEIRAAAAAGFDSALPMIKAAALDPENPNWAKACEMLIKAGGLQQTDVTSNDEPITFKIVDETSQNVQGD